jgi:hypothetical protein
MDKREQIERLAIGIDQIDNAVEMGQVQGYRICTHKNPSAPTAQFWGVDHGGTQKFGTFRDLMTMVVFPSEKLAKRCLSMTGGYVLSVAHILADHRKQMEKKLKQLTELTDL